MTHRSSTDATRANRQRCHARRRAWHCALMIHAIRIFIVGGFFLLWEIASGRWIEAVS